MDELVYKAICDDRPNRLEAFLRQGGDPNMWIEDSARISTKSFLHVCCEKGRIRCVKVLLEFGAQVDIQGSWGQTPLMLCVMTEYFDIAELLMNYNKEIVNQQDTYGNTPLHITIENDSIEGVELLLRHKADVNAMNSNGITPLMKTCSVKHSENMSKIATLLLDAGAQVDIKDFRSRRTALQFAAISKNVETVQILLNAGADCNTIDSGWRTPVTNVIWEHLRLYPTNSVISDDVMMIICMLVQYGADLNINSHEHTNALVMALYFKVAPLVRFLLLNGATQEGKFFGGITPLHHAVTKRDVNSLKELLKWSCRDLYTKAHVNKYQYDLMMDPFEYALHKGYPELALVMAEVGYRINHINYLTDLSIEPPTCLKNCPDILDSLRLLATQPLSLFYMAVLCVRNSIEGDIEHGANQLPLPKLLIDNIKLRDILCE